MKKRDRERYKYITEKLEQKLFIQDNEDFSLEGKLFLIFRLFLKNRELVLREAHLKLCHTHIQLMTRFFQRTERYNRAKK